MSLRIKFNIVQSNVLYLYLNTFTNSSSFRSRLPDILVPRTSPAFVARTALLETPHPWNPKLTTCHFTFIYIQNRRTRLALFHQNVSFTIKSYEKNVSAFLYNPKTLLSYSLLFKPHDRDLGITFYYWRSCCCGWIFCNWKMNTYLKNLIAYQILRFYAA